MSAPMGVPTQRLGSSKSSSTRRQGPVAISRSSKMQQKAPLPSRTQSDASPSKLSSVSTVLRRINSSAAAVDNPVATPVGSRKIATNSRIKKDEQNKRDMYLAFVNNALKAKSEGNLVPYEELVGQFASNASPASSLNDHVQLRRWLIALQHVVSQLGQRQVALVEAIVHMPWTTSPDDSFVKSYIEFIGMLVTARAEWRGIIVASAARRLTHHSSLNVPSSAAHSPTVPPVTLRTIFSRTHLLIQNILSLVPTLLPTLPAHFLRCFPHKSHSVVSHNVYCRNLIEVMEYCPQIVEPILSLIVDRAVAIDVEIQVELEELEDLATSGAEADADGKNSSGLLNNFDPFDTLAGQESDSDSDDEDENGIPGAGDIANFSDVSSEGEGDEDEESKEGGKEGALSAKELEKRAKRVREMVAKLDGIMNVLLKWLSQTSLDSDSLTGKNDIDSPEQHPHFLTLLSIFDRTILTTFKSRYTQFLLFYLVSLPSFPSAKNPKGITAPVHADGDTPPLSHLPNPHADYFLGLLLHNTLVPQPVPVPVLTRIASASYLASFVSRALCVGQSDCRQAVTLCCQWIDGRLVELEGLLSGSTPAVDGDGDTRAELSVFYAVVQAVFLIICFRWRDLLEVIGNAEDGDEDEQEDTKKRWINELSVVQRLIVSPLNPLKVCSPNVVLQFSRVSQNVGFVYCQSIIESNRRAANFTVTSKTTDNSGSTTPSTMNASFSTWNAVIATSSAAIADLQAFFPFDPYRLPQSSRWFEGMYRDWTMVAVGDDDEEEDEDESDEEEEEISGSIAIQAGGMREPHVDDEEETETSEDEDGEELYAVPMELGSVREERGARARLGVSESFGKMSISPIQGVLHRHVGGT